ncbi:ABC transporter substrate-binding protein [Roseateles depolymerans]|uniref:Extracellular ligand-binding receptor n=1 Tax=Roseateles depolymerans TaxID=76731 RepID=A0A0U3CVI7_9BURK|nr:ABC transporter substrate-binding protein [Roseateles depolymerans]ALV05334.1 Extracellular ligand-binding receptor [Roseateles depolymerans]REG14650.1 amino acid/amide ABC transporter substrate-binding protein (HAAT family) [Roseateles depolymerans]
MKRRQLLTQLSALVGASALPVLPAFADNSKIVLGQSAPLSGPAKELGEQFRDGALLAFDHINQRGGVNGRRIELRSLDDGYEPERCAANTRKLLDEGVTALFGYIGTPTSLAALPLATNAKVPFFAPFTGAEALRTPFNRYAFHVRASYNDECEEIVQQLQSVGIKKVAVFYQNDAYGQAGLSGIQAALKKHGLAPVATATVERNSVEVAAAVKTILAAQPEAIVQVSAYTSCAAFIRQARHAMFLGNFYNLSFVGAQALATELGKDSRGVVVSQVVPFPFSGTNPLAQEYGQRAKAANRELSYTGMEGFVAAKVLIEGLRRAGNNLSSESLVTALEGLKDFDAGGFFINFSAQKHTGSKYVDMTILTADGKVRR